MTGGTGGRGGGGSGGRIGLRISWVSEYVGTYQAFGGYAGLPLAINSFMTGAAGAAGTGFYTDNNAGLDRRVIRIVNGTAVATPEYSAVIFDKSNREPLMPTVLMNDVAGNYFEFDTATLLNQVTLWANDLNLTLY